MTFLPLVTKLSEVAAGMLQIESLLFFVSGYPAVFHDEE